MSFSENLQYLRKKQNLTQEQFAEQMEVSRQAVSKWESGQSYPEMEKLLQICEQFGCSMDLSLIHIYRDGIQVSRRNSRHKVGRAGS